MLVPTLEQMRQAVRERVCPHCYRAANGEAAPRDCETSCTLMQALPELRLRVAAMDERLPRRFEHAIRAMVHERHEHEPDDAYVTAWAAPHCELCEHEDAAIEALESLVDEWPPREDSFAGDLEAGDIAMHEAHRG